MAWYLVKHRDNFTFTFTCICTLNQQEKVVNGDVENTITDKNLQSELKFRIL